MQHCCAVAVLLDGMSELSPTSPSSRAECVQRTATLYMRDLQLSRISGTLQQASHIGGMSYAAGTLAYRGT